MSAAVTPDTRHAGRPPRETTTAVADDARVSATAGVLRLDAPFPLEHGGSIADCEIAWELTGPRDAPLVVALGGISAGRQVTATGVAAADRERKGATSEQRERENGEWARAGALRGTNREGDGLRGSDSTQDEVAPTPARSAPALPSPPPLSPTPSPAARGAPSPDARRSPSPGWWQDIAGEGRALDTRRLRVLGIDWLGGAGESTGPATLRPCPTVDTKDQARAIAAVLDHLGVTRVKAIVGASYGGMVALAFAALFPHRLERAVIFSAAHRSHPMATALRSLQRRVVRLGVETGRASDAVRIARGLAMTTYRTAHEFAERFPTAPRRLEPVVQFPVEDYLDHCGTRFAETFSPEAFLRLSESIDLHDIEPEAIDVDITLAAVEHDPLVPVWQVRELAARLGTDVPDSRGTGERRARLIEIDSIYGHDAFLKEVAMVSSTIAEALDAEAGR